MAETLVEVLKDPARRKAVIAESVEVVEAEVASKSGIRAAGLKLGFASVKKIKPGIIQSAIEKLLPEFAPVVDPFYAEARASGDVAGFFARNAERIADALLQVTDKKAERADNKVMKSVYSNLRGQAVSHTAAAMPRVASLIQRHVR